MDVEFGVKATEEFIKDQIREVTRNEIARLLRDHKWKLPLRIYRKVLMLKGLSNVATEALIGETLESVLSEMGVS